MAPAPSKGAKGVTLRVPCPAAANRLDAGGQAIGEMSN
jgi:hypothetical protein